NVKKPIDVLVLELIGVLILVYVVCFVAFRVNLNKGLKYFEAGQYEEAINAFSSIAGMTSADPAIYYRLAASHARLGQHDLAIPYYLQLLTIKKPSTPFVFFSRVPSPSYTDVYDGLISS